MKGGRGRSPWCENLCFAISFCRLVIVGLLDLSFCLFNVIREFHRFLHRVSAKTRSVKAIMKKICSLPEAAIFYVNNTCGNALQKDTVRQCLY